jgi:hypothetical protein
MGTEAIPICFSEPEPEVLHKSKELPNTSKNLKYVWGGSRHYIIYPLTNSWSSSPNSTLCELNTPSKRGLAQEDEGIS